MLWGKRVHGILAQHIYMGEPLPDQLKHYAELYKFPPEYTPSCELKLGINKSGKTCSFFDPAVFARGIIDVVLLCAARPEVALIIDHKTGKTREDPAELEVHALLLKAYVPELTDIKGWYNWLQTNRMGQVYDLSDTDKTFTRLFETQHELERLFSLGSDAFPPKQGPLCPWCPVKHCEFHP